MHGKDDGGFSFDPKTWSSAKSAAEANPPLTTSFDPKSWVAEAAPPPPPAPPAAAPTADRRPLLLAAGLSVALLTGGGLAAWLSRSDAPAPPATIAASPTPTVAAVSASRRTLVVSGPDQIGPTLGASGVTPQIVAEAVKLTASTLGPAAGDIRRRFDIAGVEGAKRLTRLEATRSDGAGVVLTAKAEGGFTRELLQPALTTKGRVVRGEMDANSFYTAAVTAGVIDSLISDFAKAFAYDFNFATDVKAGDIFEAAFEQKVNARGEAVGPPTLIYVSLSTASKSKSLYRFLAPGDTAPGWYDGNGRSTVTALMRTPVDGARITSNFGPRFHPTLHYTRLHGGTDFAAPVGTPIYAAAAGTVVSAAPSACAGNMTIIRHADGMETRYFHMSRYADGIAPGAPVTQGETIGAVGNTGTCTTGPHLHFEVHVNGEKVDPMSIDTGQGKALTADALAAFKRERDRIDTSRANPNA